MPSNPDATATFDISELVAFAKQIEGAPARLRTQVQAVIKKGANNIKEDAKKRYRQQAGKHGRGHAWRYPASIGYDVTRKGFNVEAVIGPDKEKKQGALGNLIEYGSAKNAPLPHLNPALNAEIPKTETFLADALRRAVLGL